MAASATKMFIAGRFASSFVPSMARCRPSQKSIIQTQHHLWHKNNGVADVSKLNGARAFGSSATETGMEMEVMLEPLDAPNDGVFQITLNRPQARNAIGRRFLQELRCAMLHSRGRAAMNSKAPSLRKKERKNFQEGGSCGHHWPLWGVTALAKLDVALALHFQQGGAAECRRGAHDAVPRGAKLRPGCILRRGGPEGAMLYLETPPVKPPSPACGQFSALLRHTANEEASYHTLPPLSPSPGSRPSRAPPKSF